MRVNGAGSGEGAHSQLGMPAGLDWNVRSTVCGSSWTDVEAVRPFASVAVSWSSRYDGYSWSGAENEPLATPGIVWIRCVWQFDGQWWRMSVQVSASAGSFPSWASVACPEKEIVSPTFQVSVRRRRVDHRYGRGVVRRDRDRPRWCRRAVVVGHAKPHGIRARASCR